MKTTDRGRTAGMVVCAVLAVGFGAAAGGLSALSAPSALANPTRKFAPAEASGRRVITLDNASNGSSIEVRRGTRVVVDLKGDGSDSWSWSLPEVSSRGVLRLRWQAQIGAGARAVYVADHAGTTTITAGWACHSTVLHPICPLYILVWRVGVTVSPCWAGQYRHVLVARAEAIKEMSVAPRRTIPFA